MPASFVAHLRAAHTGKFSAILERLRRPETSATAWRAATSPSTPSNHCTLLTPADPGYFGPSGAATDQNILWGDFIYVDPASNFADGDNLVRIEAFPGRFQARATLTFYGRYVADSGSGRTGAARHHLGIPLRRAAAPSRAART